MIRTLSSLLLVALISPIVVSDYYYYPIDDEQEHHDNMEHAAVFEGRITPLHRLPPYIDGQQLKAIEAQEALWAACHAARAKDPNDRCFYRLNATVEADRPLPQRGTRRYCKEHYGHLDAAALDDAYVTLMAYHNKTRYVDPFDDLVERERGELTRSDVSAERSCITKYRAILGD